MNRWNDLKVKSKLLVLSTLCCLTMLLLGALGLQGMRTQNLHLGQVNDNMQQLSLLGEMKSNFLAMRLDVVYMLAIKEPSQLKAKEADLAQKAELVLKALKKYQGFGLDETERAQIVSFETGFQQYLAQGRKMAQMTLQAHEGNDPAGIEAALQFGIREVAPLYERPAETLGSLVASQLRVNEEGYRQDQDKYRHNAIALGAIIGVAALISFLLGLFISNSISRPLAEVLGAMAAVAAGDLTSSCRVKSRDEMGVLAGEVNAMTEKLRDIAGQVSRAAHTVSSTSVELGRSSAEIAAGADDVASQTGTLATASEEMAATATDIARNCLHAAESSSQTSDTARTGSRVVREATDGMLRIAERVKQAAATVQELGTRSDQIGAIIGTIEDIADQTNLLALNAAIEAARAGDQGRGFAVVADEVRALAERTTRATREIGEMIKSIQKETREAVGAMEEGVAEVETGSLAAKKSGTALDEIQQQVQEVTMQVNQIATAAEEQTSTTGEITSNIQLITDIVSRSASGASEVAGAAGELARQSEELQRLVSFFKLS